METRTDPHRVAVLNPADYELAAFEDMHEDEGMIEVCNLDGQDFGIDRDCTPRRYLPGGGIEYIGEAYRYTEGDLFAALMERVENPGYGCRLCGQAHGNRYWYYFQHMPTGDVIRAGSKCAAQVRLASREELEDRRAHERRDMATERGHRLFNDPAARWALGWCWRQVGEDAEAGTTGKLLVQPDMEGTVSFPRRFASDLLTRFNREATLSDKQVALCRKLEAEKDQRAERQANREQEEAEATPIPAEVLGGRATITGELVSTRFQENAYGGSMKMLVKDDRGFKLWGSVPKALSSVEPGGRLTFQAAVEVSHDDPAFGFFKRPTKAEALTQEQGALL